MDNQPNQQQANHSKIPNTVPYTYNEPSMANLLKSGDPNILSLHQKIMKLDQS
jgi:hypothetical protein